MSTTEASATKTDFVRSQAIAATRSLLAAHGLSLTMDQIADGSSISRRSLCRYFESRDALVRAALEAAITDYEARLTSVAATESALDEWLTRVIEHAHRSHLAAGLAIWQLTSTSDEQLGPELREVNSRRRIMRRRATQQLTDQAWAAAGGTGVPPVVVSEALAMAVSSYTTQSLVVDLGQSIEEVARLSALIIAAVIESSLRS
jgi:AcrR family transcriptional regulator